MKNIKSENIINEIKSSISSRDCKNWFLDSYEKYFSKTKNKKIRIKSIIPLRLDECDKVINFKNESSINLSKVAIIKLNGGLGTSMGCKGPKSIINVTKADRFIDMIQKQKMYFETTHNVKIPFYLMNSFNTQEEMSALNLDLEMFTQNKVPRIDVNSKKIFRINNEISYIPPGHADIYRCLIESEIIDLLLETNIEVVFISNSDNLGATLDLSLLNYFIDQSLDFLMEVTPKTKLDIKGGTIIKSENKVDLLERAEIHPEDITHFEDIKKFSYFNTNNIWLNLKALKTQFYKKEFNIPVIFNHKKYDKETFVQFESAMGCGLNLFEKAGCIEVDRSRFFPVKKTSDLLLIRSNIIEKTSEGTLVKKIKNKLPIIKLSSDYDEITVFEERFVEIPIFENLEELTIEGAFIFDENLVLGGKVSLINSSNKPILLAQKRIINEKIEF